MIHRVSVLAFYVVVLSSACAGGSRLPDAVDGSVVPPEDNSATYPDCTSQQLAATSAVASYEPLAQLPASGSSTDPFMNEILDRGKLVVGISADTLLFGARNLAADTADPNGELAYEGFDIDVLTQVALAIFGGDERGIGQHIEFTAIPYKDRIPKLQSGEVDIVAHTMTINCKRWLQIAFSAEYFHAGQRVLLLKGSPHGAIEDLASAKATVCVPKGSTNEEHLTNFYPDVVPVTPDESSDCLVLLQQGRVDAVTGDDTVLAGLAAQDPATAVTGPQFTQEPYGLGIASDHVYFVKFVNRVLADMIDDGRWDALYAKWLVPSLTAAPVAAPTPDYSRPDP